MRGVIKVIIATVVIATLLTLGFGIFWKEHDQMWWQFSRSEYWYSFDWIDVDFDIWLLGWHHISWKVNIYNSWCLFMTLKILCFAGIVVTFLTSVLWYYLRPEAIYMSHPTDTATFFVSKDRGKSWSEKIFEVIEGNAEL